MYICIYRLLDRGRKVFSCVWDPYGLKAEGFWSGKRKWTGKKFDLVNYPRWSLYPSRLSLLHQYRQNVAIDAVIYIYIYRFIYPVSHTCWNLKYTSIPQLLFAHVGFWLKLVRRGNWVPVIKCPGELHKLWKLMLKYTINIRFGRFSNLPLAH